METKITWEMIYRLCNKHQWFTCGGNMQYSKLAEMVNAGMPVHDLALVIWLCSDGISVYDIEEAIYAAIRDQKRVTSY